MCRNRIIKENLTQVQGQVLGSKPQMLRNDALVSPIILGKRVTRGQFEAT